jgi:hypothetical protein
MKKNIEQPQINYTKAIIKAAIELGEYLERVKQTSAEEVREYTIESFSKNIEATIEHRLFNIIEFCQANHAAQWFMEMSSGQILAEFNHRLSEREMIKPISDRFAIYPARPEECFKKSLEE